MDVWTCMLLNCWVQQRHLCLSLTLSWGCLHANSACQGVHDQSPSRPVTAVRLADRQVATVFRLHIHRWCWNTGTWLGCPNGLSQCLILSWGCLHAESACRGGFTISLGLSCHVTAARLADRAGCRGVLAAPPKMCAGIPGLGWAVTPGFEGVGRT